MPRLPTGPATWSGGYTVDTPYTDQMIVDLCPAWLSTVSVLQGQPPLDPDRPLTWLDLGTGTGLSALMVAAANPHVDVWGFDHNPAHVDRARTLTRRAAVTNAHFTEVSFADLAADDHIGPAEADVIVVNGVYSWISPENRHHIVEVIRRRLKPGGLAYVMYEAPTGWSGMTPIVEALRLHARHDGRRGDLAFPAAAATVAALAEGGARSFPLPPREAAAMEQWTSANGFYAAHEYLGSHFEPLMFDEVAEALAEARCSYVGALDVTDHLPHYWVPPELVPHVASIVDVSIREMARDLVTQRALRRDVYRRGLAVPTNAQHEQWLRDLSIVGLGIPFEEEPVTVSGGQITLEREFHAPLVDALTTRRLDMAAIEAIHPGWGTADAAIALALQVAAGFAAPVLVESASADSVAACRRLNEVLVSETRLGYDHPYLASPATGSMVAVDPVELLTIGAVWDGAPTDVPHLVDHIVRVFADLGRVVREEGKLVEDPATARPIIERRVVTALGKMAGPFVELGIC